MKMGALATILLLACLAAVAALACAIPAPALAAASRGGPALQSAGLSFTPAHALLGLGESTVIEIRLDGVAGLYGYQFEVTYDAGKVSATGAFVDAFFNTSADAHVAWGGVCAAGVCRFAVTKTRPAAAVNGSGVVAQITFTGQGEGASPLAFGDALLSDRDGAPLAHTAQPGLLTVCSGGPQLQMTPAAAKIATGASVAITVEARCLADFYGYQFEVSYDEATLSAAGAFDNSFFDTTTNATVPGGWNAACAGGVCRFAASKLNPAPALLGSGALATMTFTALHAGVVPLAFGADVLGNRDGLPLAHATSGATITVYGYAAISGYVSLQGRDTPITPGTVVFDEASHTWPPVAVAFAGATGAYTATVPVDYGGMTYSALAWHSLYLTNTYPTLALQPEQTYTLSNTMLLAGNANNDDVVNIQDLSCIGGDYKQTPGDCGGLGGTDINADGVVNIQDLSLAGGNFKLTSPQPW